MYYIKRMTWKIAAFYKFVALENLPEWREKIRAACNEFGVCGTILLAHEGINSTSAAAPEKMDAFLEFLRSQTPFSDLEVKISYADEKPFNRMKVRLKKEIVTLRDPRANPTCLVGQYVTAQDWNELISDPEVVVIDTRNDYEYKIGTFKGAVNPKTDSFGQLPEFVQKHLNPERHKKVAMFCTGGIRCEKSTSYMLAEGFEEVYHLQGGILKYLEDIPADQSLWEGECFVFDDRVSVKHGLEQGSYTLCYGCGEFLSAEQQAHPDYKPGFHCENCKGTHSDKQLRSLQDKHKHYAAVRKETA